MKIGALSAILVFAASFAHAETKISKTTTGRTMVMNIERTPKTVTDFLDLTEERQSYILKQDGTVRVGPNAAFHVVGVARHGEVIESIGRASSWVAFKRDEKTVFIWDGLLNKWNAWPTTTIENN